MWAELETLSLLAQAGTGDSTPGFIAGGAGVTAAGLLGWVLYWFMTRHLPSKDAMIERITARHARSVRRVVAGCREDARLEREASERRHAEVVALLAKTYESDREIVHAIRNMHTSIIARQRLADAVQSTEMPIWTKSLDGTLMSWNVAAERLMGWKQGEVVGRSVYGRIIPPDRRGEEEAILVRIARGETVDEYETERTARDGRRVPVSVTTSPIRDQTGRVVGASTIARSLDPHPEG